jgi:hypothetical protein
MGSSAHIVHHIPGRLRLKVPGAKGNAVFMDQVQAALGSVDGVRAIEVNPVTGSVLVHYDPEAFENFHDNVHEHATRNNLFAVQAAKPEKRTPPKLTEVDEAVDALEEEAQYLAARSHTARVIVDFLHDLDLNVKKYSRNTVDLKVLVPLGLAFYTIAVMELAAATPMWATLGLFSFNHFLELHAAPQAEDAVEASEGAPAVPKSLRQS